MSVEFGEEDVETLDEALADAQDTQEQNPNWPGDLMEDDPGDNEEELPASIKGRVVKRKNMGQAADSDILTVATQEHGKVDIWLSYLLEEELEDNQVTTGSVIGIKYFGKKTPKSGGRPYHSYTIVPGAIDDDGVPVWRDDSEGMTTDKTDEDIPF